MNDQDEEVAHSRQSYQRPETGPISAQISNSPSTPFLPLWTNASSHLIFVTYCLSVQIHPCSLHRFGVHWGLPGVRYLTVVHAAFIITVKQSYRKPTVGI